MPTIRLATLEDMRAITSQNVEAIHLLPFLYIPTEQPDVMRSWGVARLETLPTYERLYPGGLIAPTFVGQFASRGELLYNGAEPAADFVSAS